MTELNLDGAYYQHFLETAEFEYTEEEQVCIKETVKKLIEHKTLGTKPGMLLGKIQSGKTKTFLAIMGLAFDNDYEIAVVLTKGTKALSKQTQERIQREFKPFYDNDDVLIFDIMQMPTTLSGWELKKKLIFIVKKQKDNLVRLLNLFKEKHSELSSKKALIIDDEADYASVGYKRQAGDIDANMTANKLDELRNQVKDASFLQVTATPYSLYLQPEDIAVQGVEFLPVRPAFTVLVPVNEAYIGSNYYFDSTDDIDSVADYLYVTLTHAELLVLRKQDKRRLKLEEVLSSNAIPGLRAAFCNFIVGVSIRQLQAIHANKRPGKYSFLVHTEVSKLSHTWQEEVVSTLRVKLLEASKASTAEFKRLVTEAYKELSPSISLAGYYLPELKDVLKRTQEALNDGELNISSVNSDAQVEALLDESGQLKLRTPLNIFIGGQILDRGVTIGNLIGFYYGRRPNRFQQDTVLQHSRMYGYRAKEDLPVTRFYTEPTIYNAMRQMHESDSALRRAIELNPKQEVAFIQGANNGGIVPCSPNKILLSDTTALRPYKRILPVGFQTDYKTRTIPITEKIDKILEMSNPSGASPEPFKIPRNVAHNVLKKIQKVIQMDEGYDFDWNGMHAAIDYMADNSLGPDEIWCLWLTDRNNARLAGLGSHTRYVATPDTAKTEGAVARKFAIDTPMLMLFRQNGSKDKGWMDAPFYWPLLVAPKQTKTAIYAHSTSD